MHEVVARRRPCRSLQSPEGFRRRSGSRRASSDHEVPFHWLPNTIGRVLTCESCAERLAHGRSRHRRPRRAASAGDARKGSPGLTRVHPVPFHVSAIAPWPDRPDRHAERGPTHDTDGELVATGRRDVGARHDGPRRCRSTARRASRPRNRCSAPRPPHRRSTSRRRRHSRMVRRPWPTARSALRPVRWRRQSAGWPSAGRDGLAGCRVDQTMRATKTAGRCHRGRVRNVRRISRPPLIHRSGVYPAGHRYVTVCSTPSNGSLRPWRPPPSPSCRARAGPRRRPGTDVAEAGRLQPHHPFGRRREPDEVRRVPDGAIAVHGPLDHHPPRERVEGGELDHGVVAVLDHHRVGRRGEVAHAAVVVHGVDGHLPAGPQDPVELRRARGGSRRRRSSRTSSASTPRRRRGRRPAGRARHPPGT